MKRRSILTLLTVVLLMLGSLSGCGKGVGNTTADRDYATVGDAELSEPKENTEAVLPENQKLIRKIWLNAETEDMNALLAQVEQRVAELEGYIENREVYNGSAYEDYRYRYANLTIRIPAKSLDTFINQVSEVSNVISANETTENITLSYVATQSRITALETEQARLLELLEQAKNLDEMLKIESKLTDVRGDLEELNSLLRVYDNQVNYGTIYLDLDEVREYTVVEEEPEGFWERIGTGFMKSLKNLGHVLLEILIFFLTKLPYIVVLAAVALLALVIHKWRKKKKNRDPNTPETK